MKVDTVWSVFTTPEKIKKGPVEMEIDCRMNGAFWNYVRVSAT
jgi:hypothetical protein